MTSRHIHHKIKSRIKASPISAVDLFCGAGGLTHGLMKAGIAVKAGIDIDGNARFAYEANNPGATFYEWDVVTKNYTSVEKLFAPGKLRLLAGCAPCTPFSKLTNAIKNHSDFELLDNFGRYVSGIVPDLVTMENVPELVERGRPVFEKFLATLRKAGFHEPAWKVVYCPEYGVPQARRRLVLLASRLGPPTSYAFPSRHRTVRDMIEGLTPLGSGEEDPNDPLHAASRLAPQNLQRIRATPHNGGSRKSWSKELELKCHQKESGKTYGSIYGRMWWDRPAPTMTTLCTGLGNGRFGHPEQDRSITLREAALFQTFPKSYQFWPAKERLNRSAISTMIGNAVPPRLARALGEAVLAHVAQYTADGKGQLIADSVTD